nr:hypothetical protein [Streptomyces spiramenti]
MLYAGRDPAADPDDGDQPPGTLTGGYPPGASPGPDVTGVAGPSVPSGLWSAPVGRRRGVGAPTTRGSGSSPTAGATARRETPTPARGRAPGGRPGSGPGGGWAAGTAGRGPGRWQRPMACVLAMVMGLSVVAFALIAVQRSGSAQRVDPPVTPPVSDPGDDGADLGGPGDTTRTTGSSTLQGGDSGSRPVHGAEDTGPLPANSQEVAPGAGADGVAGPDAVAGPAGAG